VMFKVVFNFDDKFYAQLFKILHNDSKVFSAAKVA